MRSREEVESKWKNKIMLYTPLLALAIAAAAQAAAQAPACLLAAIKYVSVQCHA